MLIVRKAIVFITRDTLDGREVLVFQHPHAGIQLPAGTVEDGETYEEGALREAYEETGVKNLSIVQHLGVIELSFADEVRRVLEDVTLLQTPNGTPTEYLLDRGLYVSAGETRDGYTFVAHHADLDPYFPFPGASGWVNSEAVQPHHSVRHLFHLQTSDDLPDEWEHLAEGKYNFRFFWVNVNDNPNLVEDQQSWWDTAIDRLRS
jgi:8-oxo-dGTP pyrophosphatase MutT (NUDIX family)